MLKQATSCLAAIALASSATAGVAVSASTSDVTAAPSGKNATAAYGHVDGNDKTAIVLGLLNDADVFGSEYTWSDAGKSDGGGNGPFTSNPQSTTGKLTFDNPTSGPFVISLKAANYFSLYYFDASFVDATSVMFNTIGTSQNKQGKAQDLSHASLFVAKAGDTPPPPTGVPSPTAALAGLGLLGMLAARRRRG